LAYGVVQQPISIAIDANVQSFMNYKSGVFNAAACPQNDNALDHAILVVGFNTASGSDYWLVKNSWGTSWGQ